MNIPRYWSKATKEINLDGRTLQLLTWGWSSTDQHEAALNAEDRLLTVLRRAQQGLELEKKYPYGRSPLREEILEEYEGERDESYTIITRNSYGSRVLNTAQVMFIDVDLPESSGSGGFLKSLFGKEKKSDPEAAALERIRDSLQVSGASFRVYRTAGGFRMLATDRLYDPASAQVEEIMKSVNADPAFLQLCRFQKSFRARLTPKPWRCDLLLPPGSYPRNDNVQVEFERWLRRYEEASALKATCRFVEIIGSGDVHGTVEPILHLHDQETRIAESLPLA